MNKRDKAKLTSYGQIRESITNYSPVFETNESSKKVLTVFTGYYTNVINLSTQINKSVKWLNTKKNNLIEALKKEVLTLIAGLNRYANDINNIELKEAVNYDKSDFNSISFMDFLSVTSKIYTLTEKYKTELLAYEITEEMPNTFKANIDELIKTNNKRIAIKNENKQNAHAFHHAIKTMDAFLINELDWVVKGHANTHPEVATSYFSARKLPKIQVQHIPLRGHIIDKESRERIANGTVKVVENEMHAKISNKGNFTFRNFPEGIFTLMIENIKYKPVLHNIQRYHNEYLNLEIEMEPLPTTEPVPDI